MCSGIDLTDLPPLGADPSRTYRLGIMGGTFDPIHYGHLVAAEQAFDDLSLDVVVFMPAGRPAFKLDKKVTSGEDRYAMTLLATSDNPHFLASRFEVDREGVTYTADTLRQLRGLYPANVEFYFITGADAITEIVAWRDAEDIARLANRLLVMNHAKILFCDTPREVFSHAEEIVAAGLDIPMITKVMLELKKRGHAVDTSVFTVAQALEALRACKRKEAAH